MRLAREAGDLIMRYHQTDLAVDTRMGTSQSPLPTAPPMTS